jgi:hypothetical protein
MRFAFVAKHRGASGNPALQEPGMALRGAGCVAVGLPRLAQPDAEPAQPG